MQCFYQKFVPFDLIIHWDKSNNRPQEKRPKSSTDPRCDFFHKISLFPWLQCFLLLYFAHTNIS